MRIASRELCGLLVLSGDFPMLVGGVRYRRGVLQSHLRVVELRSGIRLGMLGMLGMLGAGVGQRSRRYSGTRGSRRVYGRVLASALDRRDGGERPRRHGRGARNGNASSFIELSAGY